MNKNPDHLNNLRHSAAHLLAAAVLKLYPDAKPTIGPAIENGFYYDFDFEHPISDSDLSKIEKKMAKLLPSWTSFSHREVSENEAREVFKDNPYKLDLIEEIVKNGDKITLYRSGEFEDLCRGGHSENPSQDIGAFKLTHLAGAYWRGSEKNKQLTRIYGTAWPTQKELDDYLTLQEEAKKRDHRKIGKDLDLFVTSDIVGKGLPLLTSKGSTIRRELERFIVDEEIKRGYEHVYTPPLAKVDLYKISGHYPYYKDTMYPVMKVDEEELILRPMTCPHHFILYKSQPRTYKELPLKIAEIASQFRYEKSGELTGLMRVRMFTLSDAHIFIPKEKAKETIKEVLDLIDFANQNLGLIKGEDYRYRLSLGNRQDTKKYFKDDQAWEEAESVLREVLNSNQAPFFEAENEAAFYGPKIDIQVKNITGKEETAFTVQYDFVLPKRFDLKYIDKDGKEVQPIVIHRSSIGAFERIMAFLIEKYGGAFPTWLAPEQVVVIPIKDQFNDYGQKVVSKLKESNIRTSLDARSETMQARIRDAQLQKVPYMLIVGGREEEAGTVAVRTREGKDLGAINLDKFVNDVNMEIKSRALNLMG